MVKKSTPIKSKIGQLKHKIDIPVKRIDFLVSSKNRKKILFIITQSQWGGAQKYIYDLATNLDKQKYNIIVAAGESKKEGLLTLFKDANIKTHFLKHLKRAINPYYDLRAIFEIVKLIRKEKPDIIHLNSTKAGILGSLAAIFIRVSNSHYSHKNSHHSHRIIYTVHGWVFNEPMSWWRKNLYLWLEKLTAKFKDKIICVSEYDYQIALKYKIAPASKLVTIHNGIDLNKLEFLPKKEVIEYLTQISSHSEPNEESLCHSEPAKNLEILREYPQDDEKKIIGTIANFYPTKGLKYLIRAAKIICNLKSETYNPLFVIIGDGPEYKNIESRIMNYGLNDKILLLGSISEAYKYLKAFDIFVLPSVKEGFPYAILEAMSAGLPIVATKMSGIPEIIKNNINGLLAPIKSPKALAKKIDNLLNDQKLNKKFSKNNLKDVKRFSLKTMVEKTEKEYKI